jgi:hypothetical protein
MSVGFMEAEGLLRKPRELPHVLFTIGLVVASLLFIALFNSILRALYKTLAPHSELVAALPLIAAAALALLFVRERYAQFIPLLRIALRSSSIGLLVYLIAEPPDLTLSVPAFAGDAHYIEHAYYVAVAMAAVSVISPAFNIPVAVYIISTRHLSEGISGVPTSTLDIRYMVDMAVYLSVFSIGLARIGRTLDPSFNSTAQQQNIAFVAFGLHLGNYFWSGLAKALAGPYFWTWPLENHTQNLIPYALDKGALPLGHVPWLVQFAYDAVQLLIVPLNVVIIGFQLFAIFCVLRLSWLKISTLFYDLLHVGIYVLGGLFFWPWIWNNFTILLAANSLRVSIPNHAKVACIVTILLGNPLVEFYRAARLGWFDVADARQSYFEASTDTERVRVPASFFLSHSFGVSLGYMDSAAHAGHYGHTPWNAATDYNRQITSGTCPAPSPPDASKIESEEQRKRRLEGIGRFLRAHHAKMLARQESRGKFGYYYRVHHHPSNPYLFGKFGALDLKAVRAYELVLESACYQLKEGRLIKRVVGRTVERFDVR